MAEYLVIRLSAEHPQTASWMAADSDGVRIGNPAFGALEEAAVEAQARPVIVLVPASDVVITSVHLPVRGAARLLATLPFALEDQLAEDVENLHFAAGSKRDDGRVPVAVVALEKMLGWVQQLQEAGITAHKIVPENFGLARIPGTASLLVADNQVIFNDGDNVDFVMQEAGPGEVLAAVGALPDPDAAEDEDQPARHLLVYCEPEDEQRFEHDWNALRLELDSVDIKTLPDGALPRLATTVASGHGINLLQGRFGQKSGYSASFRPWRNVAALLLAIAVISMASKVVDYVRLSAEVESLQTQFAAEYALIRPGDQREIVDPVATVNSLRRGIGSGAGSGVFLPALGELGAALRSQQNVAIEAISYRASVVDIRLTAPDVATLDKVQKAVTAGGRYTASIQSTDQVADRINSRIQVREN